MCLKLVAIAKNEDKYILEWLAHHLRLNVDEIIVFDNESTDSTLHILKDISRAFPLHVHSWQTVEGLSPQLSAYNFALRELCKEGDVVGFIDIDEFLMPKNESSLRSIIVSAISQDRDVGAVCVNQRVFGSSWLERYSAEPVLERFKLCSAPDYTENSWIKSFYRVGYIEEITDCHSSKLSRGIHVHPSGEPVRFVGDRFSQSQSPDYSSLQLNHYITKSLEEYHWKRARGGVAAATLDARMRRYESMDFFHGRQPDLNVSRDALTEAYAERIPHLIENIRARLHSSFDRPINRDMHPVSPST